MRGARLLVDRRFVEVEQLGDLAVSPAWARRWKRLVSCRRSARPPSLMRATNSTVACSASWTQCPPTNQGVVGSNPASRARIRSLGDVNQVLHVPDGGPLDGGRSYVIHFPADGLLDAVVNAYWSVIVGAPDYRVIPNPLKRYNFNNHSPLQKEADGSLKIGIGPKPVPGVPESVAADGKLTHWWAGA